MSLGLGLGLPLWRRAAAAWTPASLYAGGYNGFLFDGLTSAIKKTDGSTAAHLDPIYSVADVSGGAQILIQATAGNQPTLNVVNGVKAIKFNTAKFLSGTLSSALSTPNFTWVAVLYNDNAGDGFPYVLDSAGGLTYPKVEGAAVRYIITPPNEPFASVSFPQSSARICRMVVPASGAATIEVYSMAGALLSSSTGTHPIYNMGATLSFNYSSGTDTDEIAFQMLINREVSGSNWNDLKNDLVSRFGAWR